MSTLLKGLLDICAIGIHLHKNVFTTTPDLAGVIDHSYTIGISSALFSILLAKKVRSPRKRQQPVVL